MAKKKPTAKDMADMLSNKPLPGQAIAIGPDVDPRAGQFQQAMGSMMATPDDYYRWERDQAIKEQEARAEALKASPGYEWGKFLDKVGAFGPGMEEPTKQQRGDAQRAEQRELFESIMDKAIAGADPIDLRIMREQGSYPTFLRTKPGNRKGESGFHYAWPDARQTGGFNMTEAESQFWRELYNQGFTLPENRTDRDKEKWQRMIEAAAEAGYR
tara:strand:+ start:1355 stop:1996 length:642 start_codon:yes stop_codon:yes gene_type:complete